VSGFCEIPRVNLVGARRDLFSQIAHEADASVCLVEPGGANGRVIFEIRDNVHILDFVFGCLVDRRVCVPLMNIHRHKVSRTQIDRDPKLRKDGKTPVIISLLNHREISKALSKISGVAMECRPKVTIDRYSGEAGVGNLEMGLGIRAISLLLIRIRNKILKQGIDPLDEGQAVDYIFRSLFS